MSRIDLLLPPQAKITGALRDRETVHDLDEDMLQIELPGGVFIDVGWYPAWNPRGTYRLVVFKETIDQKLEMDLLTKNVARIRDRIYLYVEKYKPSPFAADSNTTPMQVFLNGSHHYHGSTADVITESTQTTFSVIS